MTKIRLTESKLKEIVTESVKRILKEHSFGGRYGEQGWITLDVEDVKRACENLDIDDEVFFRTMTELDHGLTEDYDVLASITNYASEYDEPDLEVEDIELNGLDNAIEDSVSDPRIAKMVCNAVKEYAMNRKDEFIRNYSNQFDY